MKIIPQSIPEILLFQPEIIKEERGFFVETMRRSFLNDVLIIFVALLLPIIIGLLLNLVIKS